MGQRIKYRRELLGLSQSALAHAVGVDRSTVTGWERGYRTPEKKYLAPLANVLQTTVDYLMGSEADVGGGAEESPPWGLSPEERLRALGIMLRSEGVTEEDVKVIMDLIESRRRLREMAARNDTSGQDGER